MLSLLWCVIAILAVRAEASRCLPHHLLLHGSSLLLLLTTYCQLLTFHCQRADSVRSDAPFRSILGSDVHRCHSQFCVPFCLSVSLLRSNTGFVYRCHCSDIKFGQITTSWRRKVYRGGGRPAMRVLRVPVSPGSAGNPPACVRMAMIWLSVKRDVFMQSFLF